jgi:hypothetical protein
MMISLDGCIDWRSNRIHQRAMERIEQYHSRPESIKQAVTSMMMIDSITATIIIITAAFDADRDIMFEIFATLEHWRPTSRRRDKCTVA